MEERQRVFLKAAHLPATIISFIKTAGQPILKDSPLLIYEYTETYINDENATCKRRTKTELLSPYSGVVETLLVSKGDVINSFKRFFLFGPYSNLCVKCNCSYC